jgi:hypothetical protein
MLPSKIQGNEAELASEPTDLASANTAREPADDPLVPSKPSRALPGWAIDLLVDGLPPYTPATRIWSTVVSIAMSAQARGWHYQGFIDEVTKEERRTNKARQRRWTKHRLWEQVEAYCTAKQSPRHELDKAWVQAIENRNGDGFRTPEDLLNNALEAAFTWEERLTVGNDSLSDNEAVVMAYVIEQVLARKMSRVVCPVRVVGEYAGIPIATASDILRRLTDKGFLNLFSKGVHSADPKRWKASIYYLGDPFTLNEGGRNWKPRRTSKTRSIRT